MNDKILQGVIAGDDELETNIMKPLIMGKDVKRFENIERTHYFLIYPYVIENGTQRILEESELQRLYPLTYDYLKQFKTYLVKLKKKFKTNPKYWYALHRGRQQQWFEQQKIVTPEITLGCNMTLDTHKLFHNTTVYSFLKKTSTNKDDKFLLAVLKSLTAVLKKKEEKKTCLRLTGLILATE